MSRHLSLAAFFATVLVAVPAGWRALDADIQTDGPATRPKQHVLHTDGAAVSVDLDRGVLMAGGKLKVTLVATAETPKRIALTVRALEDNGIGEERTPNPPTVVSRKKIILEAAPGGGTPMVIAFDLGSRKKKGRVEWYDVDVTPAGKKDEALAYYDTETDDGTPVPANAAKVGAAVWSGNTFGMAIDTPTIPAEGPFTVAVRVKNTTKKPMEYLDVEMGGPELAYSGMDGLSLYASDDAEFDVKLADDATDASLEPGQEKLVTFEVTPRHPGVKKFTLVASGRAGAGGAMDVRTFERPAAPEVPPAFAAITD
jgi:hypothetical protein